MIMMADNSWPPLPYEDWKDTDATLHMWTRVVGMVALAKAPPVSDSWGVALLVTSRGLSTVPLPYDRRSFTIDFDFVDHQLAIRVSDGAIRMLPLEPRSVAEFYRDVMRLLDDLALPVKIWPVASEVPSPIRLDTD